MPHLNYSYIQSLKEKKFSAPYEAAVKKYARVLQNNGLPIILSLKHLAVLANVPYNILHDIVHRKIDSYRVFPIAKKSGGTRWITVPSPFLMNLQKWINTNILYTTYAENSVSTNAMAYIKNKGHYNNALRHHDSEQLVKVDVTRFFESISERQVFYIFKSFGYKGYVAFIMSRLCTRVLPLEHDSRAQKDFKRWISNKDYKHNSAYQRLGHLPQGAPTSPMLANLVCRGLDQRLNQIASSKLMIYTRYADDIVFSGDIKSREAAKIIIGEISRELRIEGFKLNFQKTQYCHSGSRKIVTGICINDKAGLRVPRTYKQKIRQEIYYIKKFGLNNHVERKNFKNPLAYIMSLEGKIRYLQKIEKTSGDKLLSEFNKAIPNFKDLQKYYF